MILAAPRTSTSLLGLVALGTLAAGCGGSSAGSSEEAQQVIKNFKSLQRGEFLIQGMRHEKFSGPYAFKPGGYLMRFQQNGGEPQLTVSLESQRGTAKKPYQLIADTDQSAGRRPVTISGRLYVHVRSSADGYVLRFTPKR
jgi:hypothetical protein